MELSISEKKRIDVDKIVTARTCVIGQSGSGKSYTVAVICEELAKNNIGFCIIDLEGEYFSLREKYQVLWIGSDPNADIDIRNVDLSKLAKKLLEKKFPAIFDVSEVDDPKQMVGAFIKELYKTETKMKEPYLLIVEEIDKFAPQSGKALYEIEEVSRRGRKRGLGLMIATQRPALVNKNVLSQCGNQIIGKLTIKNDLDSVKVFFPDKGRLEKLPELEQGQFFVMGDIGDGELIRIRKRYTTHKATTPGVVQKKAITIEDLKELEAEIEKPSKETIEERDVEEIRTEVITPKLTKEQAFEKMKGMTKQFVLFGAEAQLSGLHMSLRPIYQCKIKYLKKGIMGQNFLDENVYFDALDGNVIEFSKGYNVKIALSEFIGLNQTEVDVFKRISKSKGLTSTELSYQCKCSDKNVLNAIKKLKEKRLVTHRKQGHAITYIPFTNKKAPDIKTLSAKEVELTNEKMSGKLQKEMVDIKDLKEFVKGLIEESEIVEHKTVYYPFYIANAARDNSTWQIKIDAVTGKAEKN